MNNNNNHTTTLALFFAGWAVMCLACSGGGASGSSPAAAPAVVKPIPHPTHEANAPWTDPRIAAEVRKKIGLGPGWTTADIAREDAEYQKQMDAYNRQQQAIKEGRVK